MQPGFVTVVPVKPPAAGKSRLVGLSDEQRRRLAGAFALDTTRAAMAAHHVAQVLVTTDDAAFASDLAANGCTVIPDGADDLNGALRQAAAEARRRWPHLVPVALLADLPALRPDDLDAALDQAAEAARHAEAAFVADRAGTGTSLYAAPADTFDPRFGPGSAQAHALAGARAIRGDLTTLRHDVDDPADLRAAIDLGLGPLTAAVAVSLTGP